MTWRQITENKIFQGLAIAAIIGSWVWVATLAGQVDSNSARIDKQFAVWEEKLNRISEDVAEIKQDVKDLRSFIPVSTDRSVLKNLDPNTQGRLDTIEDMLRRQNCFLAGGPARAPAVCAGITNPEPQR